MGRIRARQVPTGGRSDPGARGVELTLQLLALEGATPMWPKFQHFAVDIPGHHREAERVRWAVHIYTALLLRLATLTAAAGAFPRLQAGECALPNTHIPTRDPTLLQR